MESMRETVNEFMKNDIEWQNCNKSPFNNLLEIPDTNTSVQDDVKIKVEIELKEEENGLIYEPDFYGHLRLVSLNQTVPNNCDAIESIPEWHYVQSPSPISEIDETNAVPVEQNNSINNEYVYRQLKNATYDVSDKEETAITSDFQSSVPEASGINHYAVESTSQQQIPKSSQVSKQSQKKRELSYILAEKKRNYRMRIKRENPSMWCAMKQKEACKKREQREEKRLILIEMQRLMQLISLPDSPEVENHKLYLQVLKERHPEIWRQLIDALSAAEQRNQELIDGKNPKRRLSKPIKTYKDVVEAQKKYVYRQRVKVERPDLYEQQKARDSYARSIRRMLKKKILENQNKINS